MHKLRMGLAVVTIAAMSFAGSATAAALDDAQEAVAATGVASAEAAVDAWEARTNIKLTDEARRTILTEFREASLALANDAGVTRAEIREAAGPAVAEYLEESASAARQTHSLSNLLNAQISLGSGPGIPLPRALGRIEITYRKTVDALIVGQKRLAAYTVLMSPIGPVAIAGYAGRTQVCRGSVHVSPAAPARFTC